MTMKQQSIAKASSSIGLAQFKSEVEKRAKEVFLKRQTTKTPGMRFLIGCRRKGD